MIDPVFHNDRPKLSPEHDFDLVLVLGSIKTHRDLFNGFDVLPNIDSYRIVRLMMEVLVDTTDTISLHVGHVVKVQVTDELRRAISTGISALHHGSTKAEAARQIYGLLVGLPRESIWYAFIYGANLTSRGAVTYFYNLRRNSRKLKFVCPADPR